MKFSSYKNVTNPLVDAFEKSKEGCVNELSKKLMNVAGVVGVTCPQNYEPVCGCDGKTYSNECQARSFGFLNKWTKGECGGMSAPRNEMPSKPSFYDKNKTLILLGGGLALGVVISKYLIK